MAANTVLQLTFKREDLKTTTISITDPKVGLTVEAVNTAMAGMIEQAIFAPEGSLLTARMGRKPKRRLRLFRRMWGWKRMGWWGR